MTTRYQSEKKDLKRVQMDMPPKSVARLRHLQNVTEASSYAEVVRNALRLYEALIDEAESGSEFLIQREDGVPVKFPIFSA